MQQQDQSEDTSLRELLIQPWRTAIKEANELASEMTTRVNQELLPPPAGPPSLALQQNIERIEDALGEIERILELKEIGAEEVVTSADWLAAMSAQGRLGTLRSVLTGKKYRVFNPYLDARPSKYL